MSLDAREGPITVAEAPSNIAFAKYWGKSNAQTQWPANDSLSMTLSVARTITRVQCGPKAGGDVLWFGGKKLEMNGRSGGKAFAHLEYLRAEVGFEQSLRIETTNTFPASCGIASSASGMAALTLAVVAATNAATSLADLESKGFSRQTLAHLARLGSGSAGRSLMGGFVKWSRGGSEQEQAFLQVAAADHWDLCDIIVVLSSAPKPVSSTEAHRLAWSSPFFAPRLAGHEERMAAMEDALLSRDMRVLGPLIEIEALEMHAVAMTSKPAVQYITEETTQFLSWLRHARRTNDLPAYFTLDAGCNVHVICPAAALAKVEMEVRSAFPGTQLIVDRVGGDPFCRTEPFSDSAKSNENRAESPLGRVKL